MLKERLLSRITADMIKKQLRLHPLEETHMPKADPNRSYMLYIHIPF